MTLDFPVGRTEIPQWPGTQTIDIRQYSIYINAVFRKIVSSEIVYDFYKPGNPTSCFFEFIPGNYYIVDAKEAFSVDIT